MGAGTKPAGRRPSGASGQSPGGYCDGAFARGERKGRRAGAAGVVLDGNRTPDAGFPAGSEAEQEQHRAVRRKRRIWYFVGVFLSAAEMGLLFAFRDLLGVSLFDLAMDMLLMNPLILFMGIWPFLVMPEKLPPIYDKTRISVYSDGIFRIQIAGVYFNNRNWPHITRALRRFCFLAPVCWPILYLPVIWLVPDAVWRHGRIFVELAILLGGLFIPVVVAAKKYGGDIHD